MSSKKSSKTATNRLSSSNLARETKIKGIRTARRRAASSCNAFAIAKFSSLAYSMNCNRVYNMYQGKAAVCQRDRLIVRV